MIIISACSFTATGNEYDRQNLSCEASLLITSRQWIISRYTGTITQVNLLPFSSIEKDSVLFKIKESGTSALIPVKSDAKGILYSYSDEIGVNKEITEGTHIADVVNSNDIYVKIAKLNSPLLVLGKEVLLEMNNSSYQAKISVITNMHFHLSLFDKNTITSSLISISKDKPIACTISF